MYDIASQELSSTAAAPVAPGQGILAADESARTMSAGLAAAGVEATVTSRRASLTGPALPAWRGSNARVTAGQHALTQRVVMNVAALQRHYEPALEASSPSTMTA